MLSIAFQFIKLKKVATQNIGKYTKKVGLFQGLRNKHSR